MLACVPILLFAGLVTCVPIYIAMSFSSIISMVAFGDYDVIIALQRLFDGIDKFSLMSMPFYILASDIMIVGGMSRRILNFADALIGGFRGSLALTTEVSCMFFGALSGSSPATVSAIGSLMYPELVKGGYGKKFSTGLVTSAGSVAILIPPSITFIVYGATTGSPSVRSLWQESARGWFTAPAFWPTEALIYRSFVQQQYTYRTQRS